QRAHVVDGQERRGGRIRGGQVLKDAYRVQPAQTAAAHLLGAVDRRHAQLGGLPQRVGGEVLGGIPLQRVRGEPFLGERGRRLGDHPFVVIQTEIVHRDYCSPTSWSGWRTPPHP